MLQNAYFLAKIGADTAENERDFAEILPKIGNYRAAPPPRRPSGGCLRGMWAALLAAPLAAAGWLPEVKRTVHAVRSLGRVRG